MWARTARGFTLFELMISLSAFSILICISFSAFNWSQKTKILTTTQTIYQALNYARIVALYQKNPILCCLSDDNCTCSPTSGEYFIVKSFLQDELLYSFQFPKNVVASNLNIPIYFYPDGQSHQRQSIELKAGNNASKLILFDSGRVRVEYLVS